MLKVLHIGKYFPPHFGGIETFMSQLMEEQGRQGLSVSAVVHSEQLHQSGSPYNWCGCTIYEVQCYGQIIFAPIAPLYPFRLIQALKTEKPDILHVHLPNLSAFWLLLLKGVLVSESQIVVHWHSDVLGASPNMWVKLLYPVYRIFEYLLLKQSKSIVATSPNYLESSEPLKPFIDKCQVVPLGIKISDPQSNETKSPDSALRLNMIGRLTYYKNHKQVIDAVSEIHDAGHDIRLDIVGDGELKKTLERQVTELGVKDIVKLHGSVNDDTRNQLLETCDLLLLPSIERTEAFGVVLLEAALLAKPALVSDVAGSGMSFVIEHGQNGLVCPTYDKDKLKNMLLHYIEHRDHLITMGKLNNRKLLSEFDIKIIAKRITDVYQGNLDAS